MDTYDDENPFDTEPDHVSSETSSTSKVDLSEPNSPPHSPSRLRSPTTPQTSAQFPSGGPHKPSPAQFKADFCCARDRWLHSGDDVEILVCSVHELFWFLPDNTFQISDAVKTSINAASPYIAYVIRSSVRGGCLSPSSPLTSLQNTEARHRYSEFESLRLNLSKLYPTLIIPPIPSKQSLSDYAVKQAKAKEDVIMIAGRKRMLQTFLNRIARHPILSNEHVFHRFLDGEVSWVMAYSAYRDCLTDPGIYRQKS